MFQVYPKTEYNSVSSFSEAKLGTAFLASFQLAVCKANLLQYQGKEIFLCDL